MRVLVIGAQKMSGISARTGNSYLMRQIFLVAASTPVNTANRVLEPVGMAAVPMDITEDAFERLNSAKLTFPITLDLEEQTNISSGRPVTEITGFKVPVHSNPLK